MHDAARTYILSAPDGDHDLRVSRLGGELSLHTNGRTLMLSPEMADQLWFALHAVRSGHFDRAVTETHLRLELERANRAAFVPKGTETFTPKPSLESL